jgi:hypothetical protein
MSLRGGEGLRVCQSIIWNVRCVRERGFVVHVRPFGRFIELAKIDAGRVAWPG